MKRIPRAIYQTPHQIDLVIVERENEAARLPPGDSRQSILKEIARLRMYADAKRWIESAGFETRAVRPAESSPSPRDR
jgi:hypothetical protein